MDIKGKIKRFINFFKILTYNKRNGTKIGSSIASLKANYGKGVIIGSRTKVSDNVSIGKYSYVNSGSSILNCEIGNYCSISMGVNINPIEHDLSLKTTHPFAYNYYRSQEKVIIGNDVLISLNAIILEGVKVGNGAVIGAGAVVTRDVAPFEIVGGVPARHIGWRFEEDMRIRILETEWWKYEIDDLNNRIDFFTNNTDIFDL